MIKNLIFDLDNTIVFDEENYKDSYKEVLKKFEYDENDYIKIYNAMDEYEESVTEDTLYTSKIELLKYINNSLNTEYSLELIDELINSVGKNWIKKVMLDEEIIKYLAEKYKLYIYTNFFEEAQRQRIKNIGYDKYFEKVFGSDNYGLKPFKKGIENVLFEINCKPEECIMIGDTKGKEILSASLVGMKAILFDYDGKRNNKDIKIDNYITINNFKELLNLL